ncbi:late expression factor 4 [Spodoptera litura nucleopolyhedrovirus]|uniref:Late expression factor 4 n=1 Tax=Spodoptera litura multicapsid nucleopolyhedrovirus TaxID=46242 RepID=Q91BE5_NPVST|nr:LEF-4 [Spodoptera litura nucleopolyhedrovirus]AAL01764.1 late expression factor 4 [Spodoptera litura nucleopolyhedrovirus]WOC30941.1 DNA-dependent RNA polymerase subunit LEF-4 [Spodoptera litura nucleopolyhedrovirus]
MMIVEKEISYTVNVSQDLLYIIFDTYISEKFQFKQEYRDVTDNDGVRSRILVQDDGGDDGDGKIVIDNGTICRVKKSTKSTERFVYLSGHSLVPLINRISIEESPNEKAGGVDIKRIVQCRVYGEIDSPIEIKFEQIYFSRNFIDGFDSLMGSKQVTLFNLLCNKNETLIKNSHLGSDEIMANLRIECEYSSGSRPSDDIMSRFSEIICDMDRICSSHNINPHLPHTTVQNNIVYRKFEHEHFVYTGSNDNVYRWCVKLDGVRGRGYFTRNFVIMFMDDMRMFSSRVDVSPFTLNNLVAFQCELIDDTKTVYMTDILHVFKYGYNNRTQYDVSMEPYDVSVTDAIDCLNSLSDSHSHIDLTNMSTGEKFTMKFQQFHLPPVENLGGGNSYFTVPTDGYVIITSDLKYVKYKYHKTTEVEYEARKDRFLTLDGPVIASERYVRDGVVLKDGSIYEALINSQRIDIIKARPDRLIPN